MMLKLLRNAMLLTGLLLSFSVKAAYPTTSSCEYKLLFGLSIPGTEYQITQGEWNQFVPFIAQELSTVGQKGFTIIDSTGFWGEEKEDSKILSVIYYSKEGGCNVDHDPAQKALVSALWNVAQKYKEQYKQESVGFTYANVAADFNNEWNPEASELSDEQSVNTYSCPSISYNSETKKCELLLHPRIPCREGAPSP